MKCKVCHEDPFKCFHVGSNIPEPYKGSPEFNLDNEIKSLKSDLAKTQISLKNMNAQIKANKKEYNLKVTYLMNSNKKLEDENTRLQKRIIELTK